MIPSPIPACRHTWRPCAALVAQTEQPMRRFLAVALALASAGCAAHRDDALRHERQTRAVFALPADSVWAATRSVIVARGLEVDIERRDEGLISTRSASLASVKEVAILPGCLFCHWKGSRYSIGATLFPSRGGTEVHFTARFEGYNESRDETWSGWRELQSRGVIEDELVSALRSRLSGR